MIKRAVIVLIVLLLTNSSLYAAQYECPSSWLGSFQGNRGAKNWEKGNLEKAEQQTRKAIGHDPECSMWHQNLGFIFESQGRQEEASRSWITSLELDRYWCSASKTGSMLKLGEYYYFKDRDHGRSIKYFEAAVNMFDAEETDDQTRSRILLHLSYNYTEPETPYYDLGKALELKKKALVHNPGDLFIEASIASVYIKQDELEKAKVQIQEVLLVLEKSVNPNPGVYGYVAFIYSLMNDSDKSALFIGKAMDLHPSQAQYLLSELDGDFKNIANSSAMKPMIEKAKAIVGSK
jgi:tetratricopeptide (TPR) repeat protein